jgi:ribonuclease Z
VEGLKVTILGSNSAVPAHGRHPSCQFVQSAGGNFLLDCGEGAQFRLLYHRLPIGRIRDVFITHLHGDHVFGLPPLITSWHLQGRKQPLTVWSPPGLQDFVEGAFRYTGCQPAFPIKWQVLAPTDAGTILDEGDFRVTAFPLTHRTPAMGYRFWQRCRATGRRAHRNVTNSEVEYNRWVSFAYCTDTMFSTALLPYLQAVDLLYHEATFTDEHKYKSIQTGHSTAKDAASIARLSKAGRLLLGHFSARYKDLTPLLEEAREVFPSSFLAEEGSIWHVT